MIKTRDLWKVYVDGRQNLEVLKGINLEIKKGEFVSIIGKSGSGKTTLLSLLAGLDQPTRGEIEIDGERIDHLSEEELVPFRQKKIGFIFQSYHLIPTLTVLENVTIPSELAGTKNAKERAHELLLKVGLQDRLRHQPYQLSGGEQQRVSICRALMNEPKILFADEPTGNLDEEHGEKVLELLFELRGERTLILVTHDLSLAEKADRQIPMLGGSILDVEARQNKLA